MKQEIVNSDAVVVGGGIAGIQSALDMADQGFKVTIIEKSPTIGGKMITLSKVFPTLDCSSCITTPKMASAAHHPNIVIMSYTDVKSIDKDGDGFTVNVTRKARYIDEKSCTGCRKCEYSCPVELPHWFDYDLGVRRTIYVPFENAIPQVALIDIDNCILCRKCERVCPTNAVDFSQKPVDMTIKTGAVIIATGYELTAPDAKKEYGAGAVPNVITPLQMERLLVPNGPCGRVIRPSDGRVPESIAYVQCAGSRDKSIGVPYCSRVCCMYAIKQAMLLSGSLPMADITIYYMDIRAVGKGFEEFYQNAKAMGIKFVKGKVGRITEGENQGPVVRVEIIEEDSKVVEQQHDLVVLSLGMKPAWQPDGNFPVSAAQDGFISCPGIPVSPGLTDCKGIFVAGTASGPKDIVDSIIEGGSAAMEASNYLRARSRKCPKVVSTQTGRES